MCVVLIRISVCMFVSVCLSSLNACVCTYVLAVGVCVCVFVDVHVCVLSMLHDFFADLLSI